MRTRIFITLALILSATLLTAAQSRDAARIEALLKRVVDAQVSYDRDTLDLLTTEDYIEVSPAGEVDPREKMLDFYKPELAPKGITVTGTLGNATLRLYGPTAVAVAQIDYGMIRGGETLPVRSVRVTYVCRKVNGKWKLASSHFTGIRPATTGN